MRRRPTPASDAVRAEWGRRVEAEYRSAAITQHLTLWLFQLGASPDLILDGLRVVRDELAHAALSHRTFLAAGGEGAPGLSRESLALPRGPGEPLELSAARACAEVFCLGETVAVPLFRELRARCEVPAARRVLDRVLRDEVRHRQFGWDLLEHLLEMPGGGAVRGLLARELPWMMARMRARYAPPQASARDTMPWEDARWGLMPPARYAAVLARTVERDVAPRFARLGLDARAAWRDEAAAAT